MEVDTVKSDKLFGYWKKYIDGRKMFRVFPSEFEKDIRDNGLNYKNNPYKHKYSDIKKLFKLLQWLEKKYSFGHKQIWGIPHDSHQIIKVTLNDMKKEYIDFTPHKIEVKYYKDLMKNTGSALASTVKFITQDILSRKPKLRNDSDLKLVKSLNLWAKERGKYKVKLIWVKGSCKAFEKATYQTKDGKNLPSPFGSFKHFSKVIKKYGLNSYQGRLENGMYKIPDKRKNFFNLRVRGKIAPGEIHFSRLN